MPDLIRHPCLLHHGLRVGAHNDKQPVMPDLIRGRNDKQAVMPDLIRHPCLLLHGLRVGARNDKQAVMPDLIRGRNDKQPVMPDLIRGRNDKNCAHLYSAAPTQAKEAR